MNSIFNFSAEDPPLTDSSENVSMTFSPQNPSKNSNERLNSPNDSKTVI